MCSFFSFIRVLPIRASHFLPLLFLLTSNLSLLICHFQSLLQISLFFVTLILYKTSLVLQPRFYHYLAIHKYGCLPSPSLPQKTPSSESTSSCNSSAQPASTAVCGSTTLTTPATATHSNPVPSATESCRRSQCATSKPCSRPTWTRSASVPRGTCQRSRCSATASLARTGHAGSGAAGSHSRPLHGGISSGCRTSKSMWAGWWSGFWRMGRRWI